MGARQRKGKINKSINKSFQKGQRRAAQDHLKSFQFDFMEANIKK